jgi:ribose 5-phosphate isomerase B
MGPVLPIGVGSDSAGASLRRLILGWLDERGVRYTDYGHDEELPHYPTVGRTVAEAVRAGTHGRAILICGTGIGMSIVANKVPGVYAALCHDVYSAQRARRSNNAQVLTMGARVIGPEHALTIVEAWLQSEFEPGRSTPKLEEISELERATFR